MRALFPELRTFATNADPHDPDNVESTHHHDAVLSDDDVHNATAVPIAASHLAPNGPANHVENLLRSTPVRSQMSSATAAPLLAPAPNDEAANHEEELLRSLPEEALLNATPACGSCSTNGPALLKKAGPF